MMREGFPRLVVDNSSSSPFPQQCRSERQPPGLAYAVNPMMEAVGKLAVFPPVADRAHADAEQPSGFRSAAEPVDHIIDSFEDRFAHAEEYSSDMNAVNGRFSESVVVRQFLRIDSVLREIPTDALTMTAWRLQAARRALDLSQRAVCRATGVEPNTWNQWERAKYMPDVLAMSRFGDLYGITLDWIFRGRAETMIGSLAEQCTASLEQVITDETAKSAS